MHNTLKFITSNRLVLGLPNLLLLLINLLFVACKKQENITAAEHDRSELVESFFKLPEGSPAYVQQIARTLERRERSRPFLSPILTRNGVARWDLILRAVPAKHPEDTTIDFLPLQSATGEITAYIEARGADSSFRFILGEKRQIDTIVSPLKNVRRYYRYRMEVLEQTRLQTGN